MYLEICYDDDCLLELPIEQAANLQAILEALYSEYDEDYGLSDAYEEPGEWVTELKITAIYND